MSNLYRKLALSAEFRALPRGRYGGRCRNVLYTAQTYLMTAALRWLKTIFLEDDHEVSILPPFLFC